MNAGRLPIWSCSVRGFACHPCYHGRGALLPHLFTLTRLRRADARLRRSMPLQACRDETSLDSDATGTLRAGRAEAPKGQRRAVYFLCHCPSGCPDRGLPGALPCGVRTFLPPSSPTSAGKLLDRACRANARSATAGGRPARCDPLIVHARRTSSRGRAASRRFPARSGTARAFCRGCCAACRSLPPSSRCSSRSRAACRPGTSARRSP
jgi:hypothetical protein